MATAPRRLAIGVAAAGLALAGFFAGGSDLSPLSATSTTTLAVSTVETPPGCEDWGINLPPQACFAAGIIRNVSLNNLQGAVQFCKWRTANPGEWSRLKTYAGDAQLPASIITWMGNHIQNDLQAYFAAGGPTFSIQPNTAPNACTGKLLKPPAVQGVTPGQNQATVTVAPG